MSDILKKWVSHLIHLSSYDDKIRKQLKSLDLKSLDAPKEAYNYLISVIDGKTSGFKLEGKKLIISLSNMKKLNTKLSKQSLDAVAGGGTAYIGGVSKMDDGTYKIDSSKLTAKDNDVNDGFTLVAQPDGSYVMFITNAEYI
jgi:hypothetical protein